MVLEMPSMSDGARDAFRGMTATVSAEAPRVGRRVEIHRGKHRGKVGVVFWHGEDNFSAAWRYDANVLVATMRQARGKYGYRIGVETDAGGRFFCSADYAEVVTDGT